MHSSSARACPTRRKQALGPTESRDDPEFDLGLAELGVFAGGVDKVARQRQLAAAAQGKAVDRRDDAGTGRLPREARPARALCRRRRAPSSGVIDDIALMSAPATKAFSPAPVSTRPRTFLVGRR